MVTNDDWCITCIQKSLNEDVHSFVFPIFCLQFLQICEMLFIFFTHLSISYVSAGLKSSIQHFTENTDMHVHQENMSLQ